MRAHLQLSLGQEFGPPLLQPSTSNNPNSILACEPTEVLTIALSYLYLGIIAAEKVQQSIDDSEVDQGAKALSRFTRLGQAFLQRITKEFELPQPELERLLVQEFGKKWEHYHLLENEDDDDEGDEENNEEAVLPDINDWRQAAQIEKIRAAANLYLLPEVPAPKGAGYDGAE